MSIVPYRSSFAGPDRSSVWERLRLEELSDGTKKFRISCVLFFQIAIPSCLRFLIASEVSDVCSLDQSVFYLIAM
jgi:hypothetical protein